MLKDNGRTRLPAPDEPGKTREPVCSLDDAGSVCPDPADPRTQSAMHEQPPREDPLRKALARQELLFQSLPFAALIVDATGWVQKANERAANLFGFRNHVLFEGHSLMRLVALMDRSRLSEGIGKASGSHPLVLESIWLPTATGEGVEAELHVILLSKTGPMEKQVLVTVLERTEFYVKQRKMLLLESLLENMDASVAVFDCEGVCNFANARMADYYGTVAPEMLGERRDAWLSNEQALLHERKDALVRMTGQTAREEEQKASLKGGERQMILQKFPIYGDASECVGVGEMIMDVTFQREQQHQLELAQSAFNLSRDCIMVTDGSNLLVSVNAAFERITGYREQDVIGKNPSLLSSGRHDKAFYQRMWHSITSGNSWEGEVWNRRKNGEIYPAWLTISRVQNELRQTQNYIGVLNDITKRKAAEEEIEHLAFYDILTGLANRYLLADRANRAIHTAARMQTSCGVAYFDIDHFKQINDTHGHNIGDELLKQIAQRISAIIREKDTLSRLGGDEFVLLLASIATEDMEIRLENILAELQQPYVLDGVELRVTASFGVAVYPTDGNDFQLLLKHADTAMYIAKEEGRNGVRFFNERMACRARNRLRMEDALRKAIPAREFELVYQPQVSLRDGKISACEALLRWNSVSLGRVSPVNFIPIAEHAGLLGEIGEWVFREAFSMASKLATYPCAPRLSVNISAKQLHDNNFLRVIKQALMEADAEADRIELELTESSIMEKAEWSLKMMKHLKDMGFQLAIDDFGTGYSSLAYLTWMPVDTLKIDRSFVQDLGKDNNHTKVCVSIIGLANSLGIRIVAEGVEFGSQMEFLKQVGCDYVQGFYVSRPMTQERLKQCAEFSCESLTVGSDHPCIAAS